MEGKIKDQEIFFELLMAGLWNKEVRLLLFEEIDFEYILKIAEEQSVVGLVAEGLNRVQKGQEFKGSIESEVQEFKGLSGQENHGSPVVPKRVALKFIGRTMQLEHRNHEMNHFIGALVEKMREAGIETLLVKGQEVAQCYEKPLWRSCGDVDFFLSDDNYEKAKAFLIPLATEVETEYQGAKHLGMMIDGWTVELHGSLRGGISNRINKVMDEIQTETFGSKSAEGGWKNTRVWQNDGTEINLLSVENDVVYVFVHFLNHFFKEGVGLRQICDWCRLLWTYHDELDVKVVESRIQHMGLVSEWKTFGSYAVKYLGMPIDAMPLLSRSDIDARMEKKVERINSFIMNVGNMGKNRDMSYFSKYPFLIRKCISMQRRISDIINHTMIFPLDSLRFLPRIMFNGFRSALRGEG